MMPSGVTAMMRPTKDARRAVTARVRKPAAVLAIAIAAGLLAGCATDVGPEPAGLRSDGYRTAYPIVVAEGAETLDIPVGLGSPGLSISTRENVRAFAADAAVRGTSSLVILAPAGSANTRAAAAVAGQAREEALRVGLLPKLIEMRTYAVNDRGAVAPVRLSYNRIKAMSPPCGRWTGQALPEGNVGDGAEFGCATQANLAAMVANPEDLITPRATTPIQAGHRPLAWGGGSIIETEGN
jgi:pilus assembly protein CpaD